MSNKKIFAGNLMVRRAERKLMQFEHQVPVEVVFHRHVAYRVIWVSGPPYLKVEKMPVTHGKKYRAAQATSLKCAA